MPKRPSQATPGLTRKQVSRAKREARFQRWLLTSAGVVLVIVVAVVAFAFVNEQILVPQTAIVTINNETITISRFQEQMQFDKYRQLGEQPLSMFGIDGETFAQYMLDAMIDDILIRQKATEMGISVSETDVEEQIQLNYGYDAGDPEPTSTPTPTSSVPEGSPTATSTFVYTLTPSPTMTPEPGITPSATPTTTMTPSIKPTLTLTPPPQPTPTPLTEQDFNDSLAEFVTTASKVTNIPEARIHELLREQTGTGLLREKLIEALQIAVDDSKRMIHAAHILVASEEEAKAIIEQLSDGEKFETLAAEYSLDTSNAYKGGDLGWFGPNEKEKAFEEAALSTLAGKIVGPIQTQAGWHVIKVYARTDVPLTPEEQERQRQEKFAEKLATWRDESDIVIQDFWPEYLPPLLQETPSLQ